MTKGPSALNFVIFFLGIDAVTAIPMDPTQNSVYQALNLPATKSAQGQNAADVYEEIDERQINAQMHPRIHDMYLTVR